MMIPEKRFQQILALGEACRVLAVDEGRQAEARSDGTAREYLEKTHWLWRKSPERWTPREGQRWESLRAQPLVTGLAYAMRLGLQNVSRCRLVTARLVGMRSDWHRPPQKILRQRIRSVHLGNTTRSFPSLSDNPRSDEENGR